MTLLSKRLSYWNRENGKRIERNVLCAQLLMTRKCSCCYDCAFSYNFYKIIRERMIFFPLFSSLLCKCHNVRSFLASFFSLLLLLATHHTNGEVSCWVYRILSCNCKFKVFFLLLTVAQCKHTDWDSTRYFTSFENVSFVWVSSKVQLHFSCILLNFTQHDIMFVELLFSLSFHYSFFLCWKIFPQFKKTQAHNFRFNKSSLACSIFKQW